MTSSSSSFFAQPDSGEELADTKTAIDTTVPHSARIWNYWLGGKDNYEVDRIAGDQFRQVFPAIVEIARTSRLFLARAITYLVNQAGIRQFLDVGTGLPTQENTHEIAQRLDPKSRIVYADNDPLVLTHARALLTSTAEGSTAYLDADMHDTGKIVAGASETLDLTEPVAVIMNGVLGHVVDTGEAQSIVRQLMEAMPHGSYLLASDGTGAVGGPAAENAQQGYNDSGALPYVLRSPAEIASFFEGLELVEPGVVSCTRWHPEGSGLPEETSLFGGVARKP